MAGGSRSQKPSFLIHVALMAKVSDFWGLNCGKSRPTFYDAEYPADELHG